MQDRATMFEKSAFGALLRQYRSARRMSQLELALSCQVSARHLSFLESGRSLPSRDMVLQLGAGLLLPLSARNALLQSAGFAPVYPVSPLDSAAMLPFRAILNEMIERHSPFPAMLVDRHWTVHEANVAAQMFLSTLVPEGGETNLVRMLACSPAAPRVILNLPEVLAELLSRLQLEALEAGDDPQFRILLPMLEDACRQYPQRRAVGRRTVLPLVMSTPSGRLQFLTLIAHFGTSEDVTVRDLRLELLFPADEITREALNSQVHV
ncbi:MAG: helix-turn-helix domain-containing protein [Alphaproteobacteria bacterium]|nr:helix-turn-helix domain-containing protein [Alphaproteobacteria bacterium]